MDQPDRPSSSADRSTGASSRGPLHRLLARTRRQAEGAEGLESGAPASPLGFMYPRRSRFERLPAFEYPMAANNANRTSEEPQRPATDGERPLNPSPRSPRTASRNRRPTDPSTGLQGISAQLAADQAQIDVISTQLQETILQLASLREDVTSFNGTLSPPILSPSQGSPEIPASTTSVAPVVDVTFPEEHTGRAALFALLQTFLFAESTILLAPVAARLRNMLLLLVADTIRREQPYNSRHPSGIDPYRLNESRPEYFTPTPPLADSRKFHVASNMGPRLPQEWPFLVCVRTVEELQDSFPCQLRLEGINSSTLDGNIGWALGGVGVQECTRCFNVQSLRRVTGLTAGTIMLVKVGYEGVIASHAYTLTWHTIREARIEQALNQLSNHMKAMFPHRRPVALDGEAADAVRSAHRFLNESMDSMSTEAFPERDVAYFAERRMRRDAALFTMSPRRRWL